jgi:hypothetical protein
MRLGAVNHHVAGFHFVAHHDALEERVEKADPRSNFV